jgi:transposase
MTDSIQVPPVFVGIDVAKDKLDLARSDSTHILSVANDPKGIATIIGSLADASPRCIVVEATGGLERPIVDALLEATLPVALVNPGNVRHLARGLGILAKTDAIDARVLMVFAQKAQPRLSQKRSKNQSELDSLVTCRRQLLHVRTEQSNRRLSTASAKAKKAIDAVLKVLDAQIKSLDKQIDDLIDGDDEMRRTSELLRSVPGVGPTLSATLMAELDELGNTDRRKIGALVGVAPFNHDSGRFKGQRAIRGGRPTVRSVLYMATLAAMRCNPLIKVFAQRLKAAGKRNKVVIVACMRKLLALLNAMLRENLTWNQLKLVKNA